VKKLLIIAFLATASVHGQGTKSVSSPAEQKINWAQSILQKSPGNLHAHNALAMALAQRARETADPAFYERAEQALAKSFELSPGNFESRKIHAWILLGKHDFAAALAEARALNRQAPDDVMVYGLLVDAHLHLGNYDQAEKAAQWMLDIRPGNVPALTRGAHLRELFGDIEGALELMQMAFDQTPQNESEECAWLLTHMAHLELLRGEIAPAEKLAEQALLRFPGYHYALKQLADVRAAQDRRDDAVVLLLQRYQSAAHPENLFDLAQALHRAGKTKEAKATFAQFEQEARAEMENADNANHELIFYYTDYAKKPAQALQVARREYQRRQDVLTRDAYAWALFANGEHAEAHKQMQTALAVGIRDPRMLERARVIAAAQSVSSTAQGNGSR
jgi:tetratricopeptide (TPR) repeat protein